MATKKPIIKKAVAKKPAIKKPIAKKVVAKKPIVSKMKNGGKVKKAQTGITTSTSYDPATKETTIKKSWSNTKSGSLNSSASTKPSPAPTRNTNVSSKPTPRVISKPTVSKTPISATTKGERKIVGFPSPTPAKAVGMEPKAGVELKKRAPSDPRYVHKLKLEAKADMEMKQRDEYLAKEYPNLSREKAIDKYYRIKERAKNQREREYDRDQRRNLPAPNKRGSGGCTRC